MSRAEETSGSSIFRVFLNDGTVIASYGESARTGDRVVFTMLVGPEGDPSSFHLVNLPAGVVDWPRTTQYTDAVRASHYRATRGESDYAALTSEVARVLSDLAVTVDPLRRLTLALQTRRFLQEWPARHYGYRAADVQELVSVLDESVSSAKAAAGQQSFDLSLVSITRPREFILLPAPTLTEMIAGATTAARLSDVPADRVTLRQAILAALDRHEGEIDSAFRRGLRRIIAPQLEAGIREEQLYNRFRERFMGDATACAAKGDVRGVARILDQVRRRVVEFSRGRPQETAALTEAIESRLQQARAQRLALDQQALRLETYREYIRGMNAVFRDLAKVHGDLAEVVAMAGPRPASLPGLVERIQESGSRIRFQKPPRELEDAQEVLLSAVQMMIESFRLRREAVLANDLQVAQNASAAAAGSQLLLDRARADINAYFGPPPFR